MKKTFLFTILLIVMLGLTACDPANFSYKYEELKDSVVRIELINYNNPDVNELFEKRDMVISFDFDKVEIIETLDTGKFEDFLLDLSKINFLEYWRHSDSPKGKSVRIVYESNEFEVISYEVVYTGKFDADGKVKRFVGGLSGNGDFISLVNKYFSAQI